MKKLMTFSAVILAMCVLSGCNNNETSSSAAPGTTTSSAPIATVTTTTALETTSSSEIETDETVTTAPGTTTSSAPITTVTTTPTVATTTVTTSSKITATTTKATEKKTSTTTKKVTTTTKKATTTAKPKPVTTTKKVTTTAKATTTAKKVTTTAPKTTTKKVTTTAKPTEQIVDINKLPNIIYGFVELYPIDYEKMYNQGKKYANYSDIEKAAAVSKYAYEQGGRNCIEYALNAYFVAQGANLECYLARSSLHGWFGHVANVTKIDGKWYYMEPQGNIVGSPFTFAKETEDFNYPDGLDIRFDIYDNKVNITISDTWYGE